MNYEELRNEVKENIASHLPEKYEGADISINEVIKNNDNHLYGLSIKREDSNIAPTIYLESFFEEYENEPDTGEWRERQMEENTSVILNEKEKAIAIEKALNTIPAFWKDIIIMHIVNEVSLGELSKRYGIGKTTLKYNIDNYLSHMRNNCKFLEDFRN